MPTPLDELALAHLSFTADTSGAERIAGCKAFLKESMADLQTSHDLGANGMAVANGRSDIIDTLITRLFDHAVALYAQMTGPTPAAVSMLALGGYGRRELAPWSDVDVMFLYPTKSKPAVVQPFQAHLTQEVLYPLWDCSLKVGHSTRTLEEVFVQAKKEIMTKTALLESRYVAGSAALCDSFLLAYRNYYTSDDPKGYILSRLEDQSARRAKYGNTVFNQEPDIKNGVGCLRDYQNTLWMARVKLGIMKMEELAAGGHLSFVEVAEFNRAYDFLLRVRNELHFESVRPTDILNLDSQPRVALNLGYTQEALLARVEWFMQDYYRCAQTIFQTSKAVESRLALAIGRTSSGAKIPIRESMKIARLRKARRVDGFVVRGNELAAETPTVFQDDPVRLIRVFRHCQQLECTLDFHLEQLIKGSLDLMPGIMHSTDASMAFRAILSESGVVGPVLMQMHELGVLGGYIPEFAALTCLVQHEFYHRYTADIHTLNAIKELDLVFTSPEVITAKYRSVMHELEDPALIYLTLLLHDIGKAMGIKNHSESGVTLAGPTMVRLGVSPRGQELVSFVIKNHLAMARFWQKRDVDDPKTSASFAELVGDPERLRCLYVHTFCDARGTSSDLWNSYKDTLHTTLYRNTLERLRLGAAVDASFEEKRKMTEQELIAKRIPGISDDEIAAHFSLLPDRYFILTDGSEITLHIQMVNKLLKSITATDSVGSLRPIIDWKDDLNRSLTVVNVVTWDRAGLFYKLAGAFSVAGLNILGSKVISRTDHIAIDTFYVVEPGRGVVQNAAAQESFAKIIESALVSNTDLYPEILAQAKKIAATRYLYAKSGETLQSSFPPTVDVYHEISMQRTIVEVQARDQIGLLYRLAKAIYDFGFDITFARIGTERGVAIDTFYIESANHEPVEDPERLTRLRTALTEVISPAQMPVAETA
ncbi:MAG TPA: [protein-PII] uridylyltransferase [Opitutaceae bacterium]|nr:[protein-PII] uridylyltransferase [Opitutaceae bacterium]